MIFLNFFLFYNQFHDILVNSKVFSLILQPISRIFRDFNDFSFLFFVVHLYSLTHESFKNLIWSLTLNCLAFSENIHRYFPKFWQPYQVCNVRKKGIKSNFRKECHCMYTTHKYIKSRGLVHPTVHNSDVQKLKIHALLLVCVRFVFQNQ